MGTILHPMNKLGVLFFGKIDIFPRHKVGVLSNWTVRFLGFGRIIKRVKRPSYGTTSGTRKRRADRWLVEAKTYIDEDTDEYIVSLKSFGIQKWT